MGPARRPRLRSVASLLVLALVPGAAAAAEGLGASAELQYNRAETDSTSSDAVGQRYLLTLEHPISAMLLYGLKLGYLEDHSAVFAPGPPAGQRGVQPGLRLEYRREGLTASGLYDYQWLRRFAREGGSAEIGVHRASTSVGLRLGPAVALNAFVEWLGQRDSQADTKLDRYRADLGASYVQGGFTLSGGPNLDVYDNVDTGYRRWTVTPGLRTTYGGTLLDGAVTVSFHGSGSVSRIHETLRAVSPVSELSEVDPASALYGVATTPGDTTATPFTSLPALVDGDAALSAGVAIGPDGVSFQNLALDMGRIVTLDAYRIHVRDALGNPHQSGGPVSWSVYTSLDGQRWIPAGATVASFDAGLSAWNVTFAPTESRYFKVVNFGLCQLPTYVTELEVFEHRSFLPDEERVSWTASEVVSGGVTVRFAEKLSATASGSLGATQQRPHAGEDFNSVIDSALVALTAGPWESFTFSGSYGHQDLARTGSPTLAGDSGSLGIAYEPHPMVSSALTGLLARQEYATFRLLTRSLSLNASVRPLPRLSFGAFGSLSASESYPARLRQTIVAAGGNSIATLRPDLELSLGARVHRAVTGQEVVPEGVPIAPTLIQSTYSAQLRYHPSPQLDLSAQFGYTDAERASGLVQSYRLNWNPFSAGSVTLLLSFQQDVEPVSGSRLSRLTLMPTWSVSRHVSLNATAFRQWGSGPFAIALETYMASLIVHL